MFLLTAIQLAYMAGFIDADGSIMAFTVGRQDYILKHQLRVSFSFTQRKDRISYIRDIQTELGGKGYLRVDRGDGVGDLTLTGFKTVMEFLPQIRPFLRIKQKQADLVIRICQELSQAKDPEKFLELCELSDQVCLLNTSPKNLSKYEAQAPIIRKELIALGKIKT